MPTALITGANRGIGLEFVRQYTRDGWDVIATVRQSDPELESLDANVEQLDLSDGHAVARIASSIEGPLDLLIANAGTNHPMNPGGAEEARAWQEMMMINVIAPFQLAEALLPQLGQAKGKAIAISSEMGSIAKNGGGWVPYRTSKAALNMAWSSLAIEARSHDVIAVALSPGWVKTRMGGQGADISPEESVSAMRALIDKLSIGDSGRFLRRDGSQLPW